MWIPESIRQELTNDPVVVVDVGVRGGWQRRWMSVSEYLLLVGFEPERAEYERLLKGARPNELFSNRALYARPAQLPLYITREPALSSIYKPNRALLDLLAPTSDGFDIIEEQVVQAVTLDQAATELELRTVDFLKLDTQGSELDILRGAETVLADDLFGIEVEVEFAAVYVDQPLFGDVYSFLDDQGFSFSDFPSTYTVADFRFVHRGLKGYASSTDLLRAWAHKLVPPHGAWRGAKQLLHADAVFFKDPHIYLDSDKGEMSRRIRTGVFVTCALGYTEYASQMVRQADALGGLNSGEKADYHRMIRRASRSSTFLWGDAKRGAGRIMRRLQHPGR